MIVLEAMALGRPVLATAVGGMPDVVTPEVGVLVDEGTPVAIGDALVALASSPTGGARWVSRRVRATRRRTPSAGWPTTMLPSCASSCETRRLPTAEPTRSPVVRVLVLTNMYPRADRPTFGIFVRSRSRISTPRLHRRPACRPGRHVEAQLRACRGRGAAHRARREYDVLHAPSTASRGGRGRPARGPVVVTFHGSDCNGDAPWQTAVSWCVARVSLPIFVSPLLAEGLGLPRAPVIPAAVDAERFAPIRRRRHEPGSVCPAPGPSPSRDPPDAKRADLFDEALAHARRSGRASRGSAGEPLARRRRADDERRRRGPHDLELRGVAGRRQGGPRVRHPCGLRPVADVPSLIEGLPAAASPPVRASWASGCSRRSTPGARTRSVSGCCRLPGGRWRGGGGGSRGGAEAIGWRVETGGGGEAGGEQRRTTREGAAGHPGGGRGGRDGRGREGGGEAEAEASPRRRGSRGRGEGREKGGRRGGKRGGVRVGGGGEEGGEGRCWGGGRGWGSGTGGGGGRGTGGGARGEVPDEIARRAPRRTSR